MIPGRPERAPDLYVGPVSVWRRECPTSLEAQESESWIGDQCVALVESDAVVWSYHTEYVAGCDGFEGTKVFASFAEAEAWMLAALRAYLGADA